MIEREKREENEKMQWRNGRRGNGEKMRKRGKFMEEKERVVGSKRTSNVSEFHNMIESFVG